MSIKITIPNTSSDVLTFGSANTTTAAQIAGIDSGSSNGQLALYTTASGTSTERVRVDASGNVGVGTATPSTKLHLYGATDQRIRFENTGWTKAYQIGNDQTALSFYDVTAAAERARITSSGELLVGVTTPYRTGQSAISSTSVYGLRIQPTSATNGIALEINAPNVTSGTSSFLIAASAAGADKMYCYSNGNIVNVNNSYGTLSDVKLKENIVDASPKLADVMQLKVRNFNLKTEPDHKQIGFIAQELEQIFPAMIDNTTSPNDPDDVIKSIKTSVLVPILVKAIQELKTLVDTQASTITQLQADVAALKAQP